VGQGGQPEWRLPELHQPSDAGAINAYQDGNAPGRYRDPYFE
jgi:hypothetical protein